VGADLLGSIHHWLVLSHAFVSPRHLQREKKDEDASLLMTRRANIGKTWICPVSLAISLPSVHN